MTEKATVIEVRDNGRGMAFIANRETVVSKFSSSPSKIRIVDKDSSGKNLLSGMHCDITYIPGGNNEPTTVVCR